MQACAALNTYHGTNKCVVAEFEATLNDIGIYNGNYWLKSATSNSRQGDVNKDFYRNGFDFKSIVLATYHRLPQPRC